MALQTQALLRHIPGFRPRRPQSPPAQQGPAVPTQRPRITPKYPLQNALAGLVVPGLSLLPQGSIAQADPATKQQQQGVEPPCPVVSPAEPAKAARREMALTVDMLLWGLAVVLLCTCCPVGLVCSVVLSIGGAGLGLLLHVAATWQPALLHLASSAAGIDIWSVFSGLDPGSFFLGATLAIAKAGKTLWLLGLDVWGLLAGLVLGVAKVGAAAALGVAKLGAGVVFGLAKIFKALVLAGADVWSLLVGAVYGAAKGVKAAMSALTGRGRRDGGGSGEGSGAAGNEGGAASNGSASSAAAGGDAQPSAA